MKGKNPAFLFYPDSYIMGTMGFTYEQKGKYMDLLCMQFSKDGYIKEKDMKKILDFNDESDQEILDKFNKTEDKKYFNPRLLEEIIKRKRYSKKQSQNAKKRWEGNATAMPPHSKGKANGMPLENETLNKNTYGNYNHVKLNTEQYNNLKADFPDAEERIQRLDTYMETSGKTYEGNHEAIIREWARQDASKAKTKPRKPNAPNDVEIEWLEEYIKNMD